MQLRPNIEEITENINNW